MPEIYTNGVTVLMYITREKSGFAQLHSIALT